MTTPGVAQSISRQGKTEEFLFQVGREHIPYHTRRAVNGYSAAIAGVATTFGLAAGALYAYPAAATVMALSSTSANDAAAGTGARTVLVRGLDANYAPVTETVTLNGVTPVNTVNAYRRINAMTVVTAGSGGTNAGVVSAIAAAVTYCAIAAGDGASAYGVYTVPAGYTAMLVELTAACGGGSAGASFLVTLLTRDNAIATPALVVRNRIVLANNVSHNQYRVAIKYTEKTDLELRGIASGGGTFQASARMQIIEIENPSGLG